jgi:acyl-[acyl-carrier-protein]-phospholipid O-acyltransferase / long-chain-fatty-acid--[acyl-carrier-protein] ligase
MTLLGIALQPTVLIAAAVILAALLLVRPAIPVRIALTLFVRLFYRMRVIGAENVPAEGPALLVCNHVSYIDWLLLVVAQRRVIRFVVFAGWTKTPVIRHLLRWGKVIPIDASSGPRAIVKSLQAAGEALKRGDLVCIFAEGRFTRTGFLLPFRRGFEEIAKRGGAPIIPVCLDELWGSIFSFYGDRCLWKLPRQLPYSVTIAFGKPMPGESTAEQVRLAVQQLAADAAIARSDELLPVHRQFVRSAVRKRFRRAITGYKEEKAINEMAVSNEGTEIPLTYLQLLSRCIDLAWQLKGKLTTESVVGIWLPLSIDAVIANAAISMCGRATVNLGDDWEPKTMQWALQNCNIQHILTTQEYRASCPFPADGKVTFIEIEPLQRRPFWRSFLATMSALLPGFAIDRFILKLNRHRIDDLATILVTERHGAKANGIALTHRNVAAAVSSLAKTYDLSRRDSIRGTLPFDNCVAYTLTIWAPLALAISADYFPVTTLHGQPFDIRAGQSSRRATVLRFTGRSQGIVPTYTPLFEHMQAQIAYKGETFGAYFCQELASIVATNVPDKTLEGFTQIGNKPGTVGQPLAGMAARVVNPETFEVLPAGQGGLLQFRSASLMAGYVNDEEATKKAILDGWFSTGDFARIDEQGFITIVT